MHPDLQRALDDVDTSTSGLDDRRMRWHPPGKWSAAEVLEHLTKTFTGTTYVMTRALDQGRSKARPDAFSQRLGAFVVVTLGYFPSGRAAPESTLPSGAPPHARGAIRAALVELDEVCARCADRFGERVKVSNHPILGAFTVRQWRRFHRIHTRHHMKQIARLREQMP